jgi:hypothetical protein
MWKLFHQWLSALPQGSTAVVLSGILIVVVARSAVHREPQGTLVVVDPRGTPVKGLFAAGTVADLDHRTIEGARAFLSVFNTEGVELARVTLPVNRHGWFGISANDIPDVAISHVVTISAEARRHLATSETIAVTRQDQTFQIRPALVHLRLAEYNPWLTIIVLLPGLFGLILALLHLTELAHGIRVTQLYAVGTATLWGVVLGLLLVIYARQGNALIALFWPDLFISSGVVVFALLGYLTYVAFSLEEKDKDLLFDGTNRQKQHILLTLGGRLLIAPYVALTGYAIFAATFKSLNTGAFAAFFGFFTGVWIKPVLSALNNIGIKLLSKEEQEKVYQRAIGGPAPRDVTTSAAALAPTPAYVKALEDARRELLALDGVVGVDSGTTPADEKGTPGRAIIVYVDALRELTPSDPNYVPPVFAGYRTDVRPLPAVPGEGVCYAAMLSVSHDKIAAGNSAFGTSEPHTGPSLSTKDGVWVLLDEQKRLFLNTAGNILFDAQNAFLLVRDRVGTDNDFVAFVIDSDSGLPPKSDYCVRVRSDASGLGFTLPSADAWKSDRLRSVQVHTGAPPLRIALHEVVHTWVAYNDLTVAAGHAARQVRTDDHHWQNLYDYGNSCMNESKKIWVPVTEKTSRRIFHPSDDPVFGLCPLDLYLMGLLRRNELSPLRFFADAPVDDTFQVADVLPRDVVAARSPEQGSDKFQQAWVVVTANSNSGERLASDIGKQLTDYETNFSKACLGRATLRIARAKGVIA